MNRQSITGAALIEFALVLPLLLAIVVGILYYGYAFVLVSAAQNASKLGVESAVGLDPLSPGYSKMTAETQARKVARDSLNWLPGDPVSVSFEPDSDSISCQHVSPDSIVVRVVIRTKGLLPTLSIGDFQIPPGLDSDDGEPAVTASACAQL